MKKIILIFFVIINISFSHHVSDLRILTENSPPYNFKKDGKVIGISSDIMGRMLEILDADINQQDIEILPWPRAYHIIKKSPKAVLFSTTRTQKRENHFKWVGPIISSKNILLAKKNKEIEISSYEDLSKFRIGGVTNDVSVDILIKNGVNKKNIETVPDPIFNIKKLEVDRIDLIAYNKITLIWLMEKNGMDLNDYKIVFSIGDSSNDLYYAFNSNISDEIVLKFQNALDIIKNQKSNTQKSEYQVILEKYLEDKARGFN